MKTTQLNYRNRIVVILLCLSLVMLPCQRAPAPLTELEVAVATCVIGIAVITGGAMLYRECKPKASLYWYRTDNGNGPKVYVCLDCHESQVASTHHFCQGVFGTMSYCQERAFEANTTWHGDDHCGPKVTTPIRKKVTLKKSVDGGKHWVEFKSTTAGIDYNIGFVVKFPGTTFSTNAFTGLSLLESEILANPTNHIEITDPAALFFISSVVIDESVTSTNRPVSTKSYDANRIMNGGLLK